MRLYIPYSALLAVFVLAACDDSQSERPTAPSMARGAQLAASGALVVDIGNDTTAQNELPSPSTRPTLRTSSSVPTTGTTTMAARSTRLLMGARPGRLRFRTASYRE